MVTALCLAGALAALVVYPAYAQTPPTCPDPTPTAVDVDAVPIVVSSTTDDYFVLYVSHGVDDTEVEIPVLVKRGAVGTTTLAENVEALPAERYRVEKYLIADPADVDGDCIDDIIELDDFGSMNPANPAGSVDLNDGAVAIPDRSTFDTFRFDSGANSYLLFVLLGLNTGNPRIYYMNSNTHQSHKYFLDTLYALGIEENAAQNYVNGTITYHPDIRSANGGLGVYTIWTPAINDFSSVDLVYTAVAASMPLLEDNLALYVRKQGLRIIQPYLPLYRESRIQLVFEEDVYSNISFLALNPGEGYGLLRALEPDDRPHPRNVVIYDALPNELPRVAGIITTVPQTPLSHVNLRAVQDGIPNAYIRDIRDDPALAPLLGSYVRYEVTETGWDLSVATREEVFAHYASSRPTLPQTPVRDLSVTDITPLGEIGFGDWEAFGVKAANVAVLGTLEFPAGTVPDGFAIPFYFYDEFMKANGFDDRINQMLANEDFQTDLDVQDDMLDNLRDDIKDADSPQWIVDALTEMHASFPEGTSLRYRSSTNNEDLPGFNGAGLYDSKTQDPEETEEDGIDKSLKGVFASLWTFRAFTEREFHRIDHLAAAMGVLVHPNFSDELANGVAVSFDPIYGQEDRYYVNTQVGEDLVTNPEDNSVPEEILVLRGGYYVVLSTSNLVEPGQLLMSNAQVTQLRGHLTVIHDHFKGLYNPAADEPFAMEIEFKITSDNVLAIKQARPWVFSNAPASDAAGTLALSSTQPRVDTSLTAVVTDPDGAPSSITWLWERSSDQNNWTIIDGATAASYRPVATDVGNYLRATASYTDGYGPGRRAQAVSANSVEEGSSPPPPPPRTGTGTGGGGGGGGGFGPAPVAPSFVDGFRTTRAVAENARPGDAVGDPVSATHPDELEITYSLSGTDAASFTVDEETGQISVKEGMDLTIGMTYTVNLTATDSAGFGAIIIVMIEVAEATHHAYDLNRNGVIDRDEVIKAVGDYFDGEITKGDVIELIRLYFA